MSPQFHLPDGSGYDFAVEMIPKVDALNPQAPQPSTDHESFRHGALKVWQSVMELKALANRKLVRT